MIDANQVGSSGDVKKSVSATLAASSSVCYHKGATGESDGSGAAAQHMMAGAMADLHLADVASARVAQRVGEEASAAGPAATKPISRFTLYVKPQNVTVLDRSAPAYLSTEREDNENCDAQSTLRAQEAEQAAEETSTSVAMSALKSPNSTELTAAADGSLFDSLDADGKVRCPGFRVDVRAKAFGVCFCGAPKSKHRATPKPSSALRSSATQSESPPSVRARVNVLQSFIQDAHASGRGQSSQAHLFRPAGHRMEPQEVAHVSQKKK